MQVRHSVAVSIGLRVGIVVICVSLVWAQKLLSADYFNLSLSDDAMRLAVQNADNVDAYNDFGYTGLMEAASKGKPSLAKALVKNGAHLNVKSVMGSYQGIANKQVGLTALHLAANNLRIEGGKKVGYYLIDVYADVRVTDQLGNTPLHYVISTDVFDDRTAMAVALVKNGADINAQNFQGDTLLHLAANLDAREWIADLVHKFGPLINFELKNKKGFTPYEYAKSLGFGDTADAMQALKIVMPKATDYNPIGLTGLMIAVMKGDQKLLGQMAATKAALNMQSRDQYRNTALHIAIPFNSVEGVKTLIDKGASLRIKNAKGEIPLQYAPRMNDISNRVQIVDLMLKKDPDAMLSQDNKGENLIHAIVRLDDQQLLDALIKDHRQLVQKAALVKNKKLQSPLQLASQMRRKEIANQLQAIRIETLAIKK